MEAVIEENQQIVQYTYRSQKNIEAEHAVRNTSKPEVKYVYTYDNLGNWVTRND